MKSNTEMALYVEQKGDKGKPCLLFLHYWGGTHRTWNKVIGELGDSFHTVAFDFPGWGKSDGALSDYSITSLADGTTELIKHLGLSTFILVGHSMGGKVAQLLASRHLEGLEGVILVAPATPSPSQMPDEAKEQQIHAYDNRDTALQTIEFLTARMPDSKTIEQLIEDSLSGVPKAKLAWPTIGMSEDISAEVPKIAVPTLVLAGELDRLDSVEQHRHEIIARIPGSTLEIIAESGHLLPIDQPVRVAKAITDFVETHAGRSID